MVREVVDCPDAMASSGRLGDPSRTARELVKRAVRAGGPADAPSDEALRAIKQFARQGEAHVRLVSEEMWEHLLKFNKP